VKKEYVLNIVKNEIRLKLSVRDQDFYRMIMNLSYQQTRRHWDTQYQCWVLTYSDANLNAVLKILKKLGYHQKSGVTIQKAIVPKLRVRTDYSDGLDIIKIVATPGSTRWAERVLQEISVISKLMSDCDMIEKLNFDLENTRVLYLHIKPPGRTSKKGLLRTSIRLPVNYPHRPPVVEIPVFTPHSSSTHPWNRGSEFLAEIMHACMYQLNQHWHENLGVAHYVKRYLKYLSVELFGESIKKGGGQRW